MQFDYSFRLLQSMGKLNFLFSNNLIQDEGMPYIVTGLTNQLHFGQYSRSKKGLETLLLCNNQLTRRSGTHINGAIVGKAIYHGQ